MLDNRVKVLVAARPLGMGFDKPALAFVIRYQAPGSVVAYYQQVGRAGRALDAAYGILLSGQEDTEIHDYFINQVFPTETEVAAVQLAGAGRRRPDTLSHRVSPAHQPSDCTATNMARRSMPKFGIRGRISAEHIAQEGRALSGWGDGVGQGKYRDRHFANDLIGACVELVQRWQPRPAPAWVTCIPSLRHPELVPDFARRLAQALGLPFHPTLQKTAERPEQKTMANSAQQARDLDGAIAIPTPLPATLRGRPVLLVDDMVDSRWTMTVAAWLLSRDGSGAVWPLALALTGHDNA